MCRLRWSLLAWGAWAVAGCGDGIEPDPLPEVCEPTSGNICTVWGTGTAGLGEDGSDPKDIYLYLPQDVAFGPDGAIYVVDWNNHRIRTLVDGKVQTLLGTGYLGDAPEGSAREVSLNHPTHISFDPSGKMIVSAWHNSKVLELDLATQHVRPICGTGGRDYGGDGGPAAMAVLDLPIATAFDAEGRMLVMDQANQRIRRVESDGMIHTVVGPDPMFVPSGYTRVCDEAGMNCKVCADAQASDPACPAQKPKPQGFAGDGGLATAALIYLPFGQQAAPAGRMEMGTDGKLYIVDTGNHRLRVLTTDGMINTIAGSGPATFDKNYKGGYSGDGGPATAATLKSPTDVAVDSDGTLYIADKDNSCVRKVDPSGTISTVAGICGSGGFSGDGGAATAAQLDRPYGVALDPNGNLYIADTHNQRIRVVYK